VPLNELSMQLVEPVRKNYTDLRGSRKGVAAARVKGFGCCARKSPGREDDDVI
jgi:hypothetical protein